MPKMSSKWHASPWNIFLSTLPKTHFGLFKRKEMRSMCLATAINVAFSTWPYSNFWLVKRQKLTFDSHWTSWIVTLSTWKSRIYGSTRRRKCLQINIRQLESSPFPLQPYRILGWSRGRKWVRNALKPLKKVALLTIPKSHFWLVQKPKICWKCHTCRSNIAFLTSTKSHFGMVKRREMSSKWLTSP